MKFHLLVFFAVFLLAGSVVHACQCSYTPNPPCFAYGQVDVIFEGVVLDIATVKRTEDNGNNARRIQFRVLDIINGGAMSNSIVYTGDGGSDCGYRFKVGKKYLVYANQHGASFVTSYCTRTRESKEGNEDRAYFARRSSLPTGVHIFGFVKKYKADGDNLPLQGVQVRIEGQEIRQRTTDASGKYEFNAVSAGSYLIKAITPEGFSLGWPLDSYFEKGFDKGCIEASFVLRASN